MKKSLTSAGPYDRILQYAWYRTGTQILPLLPTHPLLSDDIAIIGEFKHAQDKSKTLTSQLDEILGMPVIAELCALLQAGLLPYSMASEFGEEERKGACNMPLLWCHTGGSCSGHKRVRGQT